MLLATCVTETTKRMIPLECFKIFTMNDNARRAWGIYFIELVGPAGLTLPS